MKGWGLVVGWGGCECDGLVSNTLSLPMSSHINPSLNGQPQSSVFQSRCVVATSISVLVLLCCPTVALLSNPILIDRCHLFVVCTMSCICIEFVGVCCVMSNDGVRGVDDAVCVLLSTPKKGSTAHSPVCM